MRNWQGTGRPPSQLFREHVVEKHYVAAMVGGLEPPTDSAVGEINIPLVSDWPNCPLIQVSTVPYRLKLLLPGIT